MVQKIGVAQNKSYSQVFHRVNFHLHFSMDFITQSAGYHCNKIKSKKQIFRDHILEKKLGHFNKCGEVVRRQHLKLSG